MNIFLKAFQGLRKLFLPNRKKNSPAHSETDVQRNSMFCWENALKEMVTADKNDSVNQENFPEETLSETSGMDSSGNDFFSEDDSFFPTCEWTAIPDHLPDTTPELDYRNEIIEFENSLNSFAITDSIADITLESKWLNLDINPPEEDTFSTEKFAIPYGSDSQNEIRRFISFAFDQQTIPRELVQELQEQLGVRDHRFVLFFTELLEKDGILVFDDETYEIISNFRRLYAQYQTDFEFSCEACDRLIEQLTEVLFGTSETDWICQEKKAPERGVMSTAVNQAGNFLSEIHQDLTLIPEISNRIVRYLKQQHNAYLQAISDSNQTCRHIPKPLKTLFSKKKFHHSVRLFQKGKITQDEFLERVIYSIDIALVILENLSDSVTVHSREMSKHLLECQNRIVESCASSVIQMVEKKRSSQQYADKADDIQEGLVAMCIAARMFDLKSNVPVMAYASFWITQYLQRSFKKRIPIYIPAQRWTQLLSCLGSCGQISFWDQVQFVELPDNLKIFQVFTEEVNNLSETDWYLLESVAQNWKLVYEDRSLVMPESEELKSIVRNEFEKIPERHQKILKDWFGFENTTAKTLEKIASELHLSRQRVQQLAQRGLRLLEAGLRNDKQFALFHPEFQITESEETNENL